VGNRTHSGKPKMTKRQSSSLNSRAYVAGTPAIEPPPVTVLHVDDDPNDTELLRAAARKAGVNFVLHNAEDAEHAIAYLSGSGQFADREAYALPALILLDLKMPRATGFEVLKCIRQHTTLGHVPVVILSGSELQDDIQEAYNVGATSYMVKPLGFESLVQLVKNINAAWILALPKAAENLEVPAAL